MITRSLSIDPAPRIAIGRAAEVLRRLGLHECARLGEGTALAARWNHRRSTDLDFFSSGEAIDTLFYGGFHKVSEVIGDCRRDGIVSPGIAQLVRRTVLHFEIDGVPVSIGRVDSFHGDQSGEAEALTGIELAASTDILHKKLLYRTLVNESPLDRDVYDYFVARRKDSASFLEAWGLLSVDQQREIVRKIARWAEQMPGESGRLVESPAYPHLAENLRREARMLFEKEASKFAAPDRQQGPTL